MKISNPKIAALINNINKKNFYSWLINDQKYKDQNGDDYDGACPCFYWVIKDFDLNIELNCHCWRGGPFEYSGLEVNGEYEHNDLEVLAKVILNDISERWNNTDWAYKINDGEIVEYVKEEIGGL